MKRKFLITLLTSAAFVVFGLMFAACGSDIVLSAPDNIRYDGTTITWNAVENADGYTVRINEGSEYTVTAPRYPYAAKETQFNVTIKATSKVEGVDPAETTKTFVGLPKIAALNLSEDGVISWDPVDGATGYAIRLNNVELDEPVTVTQIDNLEAGQHSVQVRPIVVGDDSYFSIWSDAKTLTILGQVEKDKIQYANGRITWPVVNGAKCYEVSVNGLVVDEDCQATYHPYDAQNIDFQVSVKAIGNKTTTFDGKVSDVKKFVYLDTVTKLTIEDGIITWDPINNATGYKLKLDNVEQTVTLTEAKYEGLKTGKSVDVQVQPISDDSTYFSSWSDVKSVLILPSPVLSWNADYALDGEANNNTYWDSIDGAAGYVIKLTKPDKTHDEFPLGATIVSYGYEFLEVGEYKIEAKSVAPGGNTYDSKYSTPITVKRLAAPTEADKDFIVSDSQDVRNGFTVTFKRVEGARGYELTQDGVEEAKKSTDPQFSVKGLVTTNDTEDKTINFKIKSKGTVEKSNAQTYVTLDSLSASSLSFEIKILATPKNPDMDGFKFKFEGVTGNNQYAIDVGAQVYTSGDTEYDLSTLNAGPADVRVCAKGNGGNVLPSNYSTAIRVIRLQAPTNIKIGINVGAGEGQEGVVTCDPVDHARSYQMIIDGDDQNPLTVNADVNINNRITTSGTAIYMESVANYHDVVDNNIYYMTSRKSNTYVFIKLAAPEFGEVKCTNAQLMWNGPKNINSKEYTPTYEVFNENDVLEYNGQKNGTNLDISDLEGGEYTFKVKAIGNGTKYVNSDMSEPVTLTKLDTPGVSIDRENGKYVWSGVVGASSYTAFIDGKKLKTEPHDQNQSTYEFVPQFEGRLNEHEVKIYAVGDGGYTTIDSRPYTRTQQTRQLEMPAYSVAYSHPEGFVANGTIDVTITQEVAFARGYSYKIGGAVADKIEDGNTSYSRIVNAVGDFQVSAYAKGGSFDDNDVFCLDSSSGKTVTITLLSAPNPSSIVLSGDGKISWSTIGTADDYSITIEITGEEPIELSGNRNKSSYIISNYAAYKGQGKTLTVTIRATGNGTTKISSAEVTKTWTNI